MLMNKKITRREMFRYAGAAGVAALLGPRLAGAAETASPPAPELPKVPRRVLGKTKQTVPILLVGGSMRFDAAFDPRLAEAMRFGVNYIDTADCYAGGASEIGVGGFLEKTGQRKDVWITTKTDKHDPKGATELLQRSLERMKTDHVDMFFLHALNREDTLSPEIGKYADQLKKEGKIRFFGFSCHDHNVAELLQKASTLPWIDAVMFKYNFRDYGNDKLNRAMDAAHKSGVGLIAMKTQGSAVSFEDGVKKFTEKNFTRQQAVLKAVWADERISAAVSHMDTLEKMKQNIAAALDRTSLAASDLLELHRYADATRHLYCAGCQHICNAAVPAGIEIGTTLRYLMYHDSYRDVETARQLYAQLPESARHIEGVDFSKAAALCPHQLDIAKHMRRAAEVLA
jgi:predicted aldo/keto reductase-like oxidoreductase